MCFGQTCQIPLKRLQPASGEDGLTETKETGSYESNVGKPADT